MTIAASTATRVPTSLPDLADPDLLRSRAYIDGQWVDADSGETFAVENPANGEVLADVANCGAAETRRAIAAADRRVSIPMRGMVRSLNVSVTAAIFLYEVARQRRANPAAYRLLPDEVEQLCKAFLKR